MTTGPKLSAMRKLVQLKGDKLGRARGVIAYGLGPMLGLASGPILARALGPEGRGQFAAIMQPISVAAAIASIGIPTAVTYFIARSYDRMQTLKIALWICAPVALLTYCCMIWYANIVAANQGINAILLWGTWIAVIASAIVQILRAYWQGLGNWKRLDWERATFAVLRFLGVCGVAVVGISIAGPYAIVSLSAFVVAATILYIPRRNRKIASKNVPNSKQILKYSLSASIGTIAIVASSRLDQIVLPAATSSVELGYYAIAVTVAEVPVIFGVLAARNILQFAASGQTLLKCIVEVRMYIFAGMLACASAAVAAPIAVPLVFGHDFEASVPSVQILAVSSVLTIFTMTAISLISGLGYPLISSFLPLSGGAATVLLFYIYWESISSVTAAVISLVSQVVVLLVGLCAVLWVKNRQVEAI